MIAAARVELATLLARPRLRLLLAAAALIPVLVALLSGVLAVLVDEAGPGLLSRVTYTGTFDMVLFFGLLATIYLAATTSSAAHRHRVWQALVLTGRARWSLVGGRLLVAWAIAAIIAIVGMASGLGTSAMQERLIDRYPQTWEEVATSDVTATALAHDAGITLLLLVVAATLAAAVGTIVRSTATTLVLAIGYAMIEGTIVTIMAVIRLEGGHEEELVTREPWALTQAAGSLMERIGPDPRAEDLLGATHTAIEPQTALLSLGAWCAVAIAGAIARATWSDT